MGSDRAGQKTQQPWLDVKQPLDKRVSSAYKQRVSEASIQASIGDALATSLKEAHRMRKIEVEVKNKDGKPLATLLVDQVDTLDEATQMFGAAKCVSLINSAHRNKERNKEAQKYITLTPEKQLAQLQRAKKRGEIDGRTFKQRAAELLDQMA